MLAMVKDTPSIPLDRLSGSKTQLMTDPSKLVETRVSAPLMAMLCPWCAEVVSCTFLSLESPQIRILRGNPAVHLTGLHEWDPSVLDYTYPSGDGEPPWSTDPTERFSFDPNFDGFGDYTHRAIQTLNILDDSSQPMTPFPTIRANQHVVRTNKHVVNNDTPDYEKLRPYFGWVNVDMVQKAIEQSTQWGVSIPNTFP